MTLPQFCLAYIESPWVWLRFKPPLPAHNARFSLGRVVALTLGQILVAAIIGWAIGVTLGFLVHGTGPLVLFRGPFGWIIWLLAGFSACQGVVGYGLTALCWNQRAARLRANPALATGLPPTRYRVFRRLLGFVYFVLLAVITPAALFLTVENLRGEMLWRRERAKLVAQGERLEFRELLGPAIPPDQNAGAAALFAPLFDYRYEKVAAPDPEAPDQAWQTQQAVWRDTSAVQRLQERLQFPDGRGPKADKESPHTPAIDLAGWAEAYRSLLAAPRKDDPSWVAELKLPPATNDRARTVLAGLAVSERELAALCDASRRPRSQFPVRYEEWFSSLLRHLSILKGAQVLLSLRCAAHLELGENDAAYKDAECALRVAELLREEPLLLSHLVRMAQGAIAVRTLWQGQAQHRWTDAQWASLLERLAQVEYVSGVTLAFEGERACGIQGINSWIAHPELMSGSAVPGISSRGFLRQNQIALARFQTRQLADLRAALSNAPLGGLAPLAAAASTNIPFEAWTPYNFLVCMLTPATDKAMARTARAQTINRMAIVACALERYHLAHGEFPERLDQLAPQCVAQVPLDPMNRQSLHYQRTDDGWFRLYSVGPNGVDDGGLFKAKSSEQEKDWPWPVPTRPEKLALF
jgi:hypothetical protein